VRAVAGYDDGVDPALRDRITNVLAGGVRLRLAIAFGSRARGDAREDSDLDVAILPSEETLTLADEAALAAALERAAGVPVDLVRIDHASEGLRWRIARDAVVLWADPPHEAPRFLARTGIEHDERADLEREASRRFRARLAGGGRG